MADSLLSRGPATRGGDRYQVVVHVDTASLRDGDGDSELADGAPIAAQTARRLACDAAIVPLLERAGRPLSVGRKTRTIPPALRRALESRDRGCRFPGCAAARAVDAHHIVHWANGGPTSLDNPVQLCRHHHHRLLHEGRYTVTKQGADFVFRRPDGRRIRHIPPAGRAAVATSSAARTRAPTDRSTPRQPSRSGPANASTSPTTSTHCSPTHHRRHLGSSAPERTSARRRRSSSPCRRDRPRGSAG
jgi:Domain of unknown function (DUF222)